MKEGTYHVLGREFSAIVRITGKEPYLQIVSAIDLDIFMKTGEIVKLDSESYQINEMSLFPEKFVFSQFDWYNHLSLEKSDHIKGNVEIDNDLMKEWEDDLYFNHCNNITEMRTQAKIVNSGYSRDQAAIILKSLKSRLWRKHRINF